MWDRSGDFLDDSSIFQGLSSPRTVRDGELGEVSSGSFFFFFFYNGIAAVEGSTSSLSSFLKTQRFPAGPWEGRCSFGFCGREAEERSCFLAPSPYRHHPVTQQGPDSSPSATAPFPLPTLCML